MDSLNITIDGHLGMPGFSHVRVPPPFGTPRDAVRTIEASHAGALSDEMLAALAVGRQALRGQWRQRATVLAIGMVCTVAAALIGSYTGKRRQPLPQFDQAPVPVIAQAPSPAVPPEVVPAEAVNVAAAPQAAENASTAAAQPAAQTVDEAPALAATTAAAPITPVAPVASATPVTAAKPRVLARAVGSTARQAAPARKAAPVPVNADDDMPVYRPMAETAPITSGYVAPGTSVRIDLQRHTRLTD